MMRINGMNNVGSVYKPNKANKLYGNSAVASSKDEVTFSSFAMELASAKKEVDKVPDVRMDKVNDLKAQIEAGKYNIAASQIADKLLGRM